jgi:hypothetical protein
MVESFLVNYYTIISSVEDYAEGLGKHVEELKALSEWIESIQ